MVCQRRQEFAIDLWTYRQRINGASCGYQFADQRIKLRSVEQIGRMDPISNVNNCLFALITKRLNCRANRCGNIRCSQWNTRLKFCKSRINLRRIGFGSTEINLRLDVAGQQRYDRSFWQRLDKRSSDFERLASIHTVLRCRRVDDDRHLWRDLRLGNLARQKTQRKKRLALALIGRQSTRLAQSLRNPMAVNCMSQVRGHRQSKS